VIRYFCHSVRYSQRLLHFAAGHNCVNMAKFNDTVEQRKFIDRHNVVFGTLLNLIPVENQQNGKNLIDQLYAEFAKIYSLPMEKNPMEAIAKDLIRAEKLYQELKDSVVFVDNDSTKSVEMDTIENCVDGLKTLKVRERNRKCQIRLVQYQAGEVASKLKFLTKSKKHFEIVIKKECGYSVPYAYFLIKLYKVCNKYPNLRYTTISTTKLKNNFSELIQYMEKDYLSWLPSPNVLTPTTSVF
jgi:hypothetical protein